MMDEANAPRPAVLIEQAEFEANIDHYVDAAEAGQLFWITRDGKPICSLRSAIDSEV